MNAMKLLWYERGPDGTRTWGCSWLVLVAAVVAIIVVVVLWD